MTNVNYDFLRFRKAEQLKKYHKALDFVNKGSLDCKRINNVTLLPLKPTEGLVFGKGGAVDNHGHYIECSGREKYYWDSYSFDISVNHIEERVVFCGPFLVHWGHFIVDCIQRLWYSLENDHNIDKYVFIVFEGSGVKKEHLQGNYREFFELLGIYDKLEFIDKPTKFSHILIPDLAYMKNEYYTQEYVDLLNHITEAALKKSDCATTCEKIFLTRSRFPKSKKIESGMEIMDSFFSNNGYHLISPENMKLSDLIKLMNSVKECATLSGSITHNFLFTKDELKVVIVERCPWAGDNQADIDIIKKLSTTYIDGHYCIRPTPIGDGPFLYAWNKHMKNYAEHYDMVFPDKAYLSKRYIKNNIKTVLKRHFQFYKYAWGLEPWQISHTDLIVEAYFDSYYEVNEYLDGSESLFFTDKVFYRKKAPNKRIQIRKNLGKVKRKIIKRK